MTSTHTRIAWIATLLIGLAFTSAQAQQANPTQPQQPTPGGGQPGDGGATPVQPAPGGGGAVPVQPAPGGGGATPVAGEGAEAPMATLGEEEEAPVPFPYAPLSQDQRQDYEAGLARLQRLSSGSSAPPDKNLYACWVQRLQNGGDDKLIEWTHVCPGITGGAASSTCVRSALSEYVLADAMDDADDVEEADESLHFISRLKAYIAVAHASASGSDGDQRFLGEMGRIGAEVALAQDRFATLANTGGGYGLVPQYQALSDWIERKAVDPASVVSCVAEHGSQRLSSAGSGSSSSQAGSQ